MKMLEKLLYFCLLFMSSWLRKISNLSASINLVVEQHPLIPPKSPEIEKSHNFMATFHKRSTIWKLPNEDNPEI
jgi:hypothetical protein